MLPSLYGPKIFWASPEKDFFDSIDPMRTFGPERRGCGGSRTFVRRQANFSKVPGADIARAEKAAWLGVKPAIDRLPLSGSIETFEM
jgi:hypothetical protein